MHRKKYDHKSGAAKRKKALENKEKVKKLLKIDKYFQVANINKDNEPSGDEVTTGGKFLDHKIFDDDVDTVLTLNML